MQIPGVENDKLTQIVELLKSKEIIQMWQLTNMSVDMIDIICPVASQLELNVLIREVVRRASSTPAADSRKKCKARGSVAACLNDDAPPPFHADKFASEMKLTKDLLDAHFQGHPAWKKRWELEEYDRIMQEDKEKPPPDTPWILLKSVAVPGAPDIFPWWHNTDNGESLEFDAGDPRQRERQ